MQNLTQQSPEQSLAGIDADMSLAVLPVAHPPADNARRLQSALVRAGSQEISRLAGAVERAVEAAAGVSTAPHQLFEDLARLVPRWHFAMLNDTERNEALADAVRQVVRPGDLVLDIGAGTGLLAMLAARAGAAKVVSCEANPLLAEIARQVVAAHGLSDVVTVVPVYSTDLRIGRELSRPADVIVSEIVDCGLIGEGILPTMRDARTRLLAPGGRLLPSGARLYGALLHSDMISRLNQVGTALGFDVSLMNSVATAGHYPVRLATWPHTFLSDPVLLTDFDFVDGPLDDGSSKVTVPVHRSGPAHGLVAWFEMDLTSSVTLRNSADNVGSHWMQALVPFDRPRDATAHEDFELRLHWSGGRLYAD
jgi:type II protein arginine methyltransferase